MSSLRESILLTLSLFEREGTLWQISIPLHLQLYSLCQVTVCIHPRPDEKDNLILEYSIACIALVDLTDNLCISIYMKAFRDYDDIDSDRS